MKQERMRWVVRVIGELDRVLEGALRARRVEDAPPPSLTEDDERELRVCRDTLRAAVDAVESLTAEVRKEALRYGELVEFLPSPYVETDLAGVIRRANAAALRMLRSPAPLVCGKPLVAFVVERDFAEFLQSHRLAAATQPCAARIVTLRPQQGEPLRASVAVGALLEKAGAVAGFRCLLRAIEDQ